MGDAQDNPENSCSRVGVSPMLLSIAASIEVNETVKLALGREPDLANRLMSIDISTLGFDFFDIGKAEDCEVCSKPQKEPAKQQNNLRVTQLCSQSYNVSPGRVLKLDLDKLAEKLDSEYSVQRRKRFLVVNLSDEVRITIMPAGNVVIKGVASAEEASKVYRNVIDE